MHHTTGSPVVIGEVPATTSADRPSPPEPARTGQTSADTGTATITQPVYPNLTELPLPNAGGQTLSNFGGERCGGPLPEALRVSCNTAFGQLGLDLGGAKLTAGAEAFGFNKVPPLDLPFGASSAFPPASAFDRDKPALAKSAIGQQDVSATPLEMALVAAAVANDGTIMQPTLVDRIVDPDGKVIQRSEPNTWKEPMTPQTAAELTAMMTAVVQGGTGVAAQIPGVQVAGKTGTAETGRTGENDTWFIAFAPAEDPQVAVAVALSNQSGTGGATAAPIAKEIMEALLR